MITLLTPSPISFTNCFSSSSPLPILSNASFRKNKNNLSLLSSTILLCYYTSYYNVYIEHVQNAIPTAAIVGNTILQSLVNSNKRTIAVNGTRQIPASIAPHATNAYALLLPMSNTTSII
eukprot:EC097472.1.p3 GENE.EC097472.1~~EC097472.1.p3  ORF type:complete len:120 (-),score=6.42 EC097472.1:81-440(-)